MERLQPRNEDQNTAATGLAKKLLKAAFWCAFIVMGFVGLYFTVTWTTPQEVQVQQTVQAVELGQTGSLEMKLEGTAQQYRLRNNPDVFRGTVEIDGQTYRVELSFDPDAQYAYCAAAGDKPVHILVSRDLKTILLRQGDRRFLAPGEDAEATLARLKEVIRANEQWALGFEL